MVNRSLAILLSLMVTAPSFFPAVAQTTYPAGGGSQDMGAGEVSARAAALGGAFLGGEEGASVLLSNPAGLSLMDHGQVFLHGRLGIVQTHQETLVLGWPLGDDVGVGIALGYSDHGDFEGRDILGSIVPGYRADQWDLRLGAGGSVLEGVALGAALRSFRRDWAGTVEMVFVPEAGIWVQPSSDWELSLAYVLPGWGPADHQGVSRWDLDASWEVPLGGTLRLNSVGGGTLQSNGLQYLRVGMELSLESRFFLRGGYKTVLEGALVEGPSLGAGVAWSDLLLDYAFLPGGDLGNAHRLSLGYSFREGDDPREGKGPGTADKAGAASRKSGAATTSKVPKDPPSVPSADRTDAAIERPGTLGTVKAPKALSPTPSTGILSSSAVPSSQGIGSLPSLPGLSSSSSSSSVTVLVPQGPASSPRTEKEEEGAKDSLDLRFDIPPDYLAKARRLEAEGRPQEAVDSYKQALQQDQRNVQAWWSLGNLYARQGQKAAAIQCLEAALRLRPDNQALKGWLERYKKQP